MQWTGCGSRGQSGPRAARAVAMDVTVATGRVKDLTTAAPRAPGTGTRRGTASSSSVRVSIRCKFHGYDVLISEYIILLCAYACMCACVRANVCVHVYACTCT